jgi:D-2-hydroxyacid dehydrogenase (NADP+)
VPTILVHPTNGRLAREDLVDVLPDADIIQPEDAEDVPDALRSADGRTVLLTNNDSFQHAYLDAMDAGDWVATTATGYEKFDFDRFEDRDIRLTHMPTIYGPQVSEHAVSLVLAVSRRLYDYDELQEAGRWQRKHDGMTDLYGDVACVVGLGNIGEATAKRCRAFGMTVRGVKRTVEGYDGAAHEVYTQNDLLEALDGARVVILVVPLTDETRGMIGADELAVCRDDAILVNAARGPVVETGALTDALDAGTIRAAGLDVFDEEPLPPESPLWDREDVYLTPHVAGWSDKLPRRSREVFEEQVTAWTADEPLPHRLV